MKAAIAMLLACYFATVWMQGYVEWGLSTICHGYGHPEITFPDGHRGPNLDPETWVCVNEPETWTYGEFLLEKLQ